MKHVKRLVAIGLTVFFAVHLNLVDEWRNRFRRVG
jgi:hypothetical protein